VQVEETLALERINDQVQGDAEPRIYHSMFALMTLSYLERSTGSPVTETIDLPELVPGHCQVGGA
jgi:prenyltransferase beta subunit